MGAAGAPARHSSCLRGAKFQEASAATRDHTCARPAGGGGGGAPAAVETGPSPSGSHRWQAPERCPSSCLSASARLAGVPGAALDSVDRSPLLRRVPWRLSEPGWPSRPVRRRVRLRAGHDGVGPRLGPTWHTWLQWLGSVPHLFRSCGVQGLGVSSLTSPSKRGHQAGVATAVQYSGMPAQSTRPALLVVATTQGRTRRQRLLRTAGGDCAHA